MTQMKQRKTNFKPNTFCRIKYDILLYIFYFIVLLYMMYQVVRAPKFIWTRWYMQEVRVQNQNWDNWYKPSIDNIEI